LLRKLKLRKRAKRQTDNLVRFGQVRQTDAAVAGVPTSENETGL